MNQYNQWSLSALIRSETYSRRRIRIIARELFQSGKIAIVCSAYQCSAESLKWALDSVQTDYRYGAIKHGLPANCDILSLKNRWVATAKVVPNRESELTIKSDQVQDTHCNALTTKRCKISRKCSWTFSGVKRKTFRTEDRNRPLMGPSLLRFWCCVDRIFL